MQLKYNPYRNKFSDDSWIDWFIIERPETAWLSRGNYIGPMSDSKHRDAKVDFHHDKMVLTAPITRDSGKYQTFSLKQDCTVLEFLTAIYDFYHQGIDKEWLDQHRSEEELECLDSYQQNAIHRCKNGSKMKLVELLGRVPSDSEREESDNSFERRHPLSCSGLVRYEGISKDMILLLGS